MVSKLFVATRKGLFVFRHHGAGVWLVERTAFLGDSVTMVLEDPRDQTLYAALNLGHFGVKMHRSRDGGETWLECEVPALPAAEGGPSTAVGGGKTVQQIWALETAGAEVPGMLWAGTIPAALFRSNDRGASWDLNQPLWQRPERAEWFGGGYDDAGIHSICVDPRNRMHLTVAISCGGVWASDNGGYDWELRADGMVADYVPPQRRHDPNIQDPHRVVQCPAAPDVIWAQHHNGIFRTVDGGKSWEAIEGVEPSSFGFAVAVHPKDPDTAWFVPAVKDDRRYPVDGKLVVTRTRNGGRSFEQLRTGLPQDHAYDLVYRHAMDVAADGEHLAFGSTTGNLWVTRNGGSTWAALSTHLPPIWAVRYRATG